MFGCCTGYRCWLSCVITVVILIILLSAATILLLFNQQYIYTVLPVSKDAIKLEEQNETCTIINPLSNIGNFECTFPHSPVRKVTLLQQKPGSYFLTSVFCEQFPNLQVLDVGQSYIGGLTNDALHFCHNLTEITLAANNLVTLEKDFFSRNFLLEKIDLSQNKLGSILTTAFFNGINNEPNEANMTETLRELDLSENELRIFSTITVGHLKNLEVLKLHGNYPLKGFDVKFVLERLKNLKEMTFCPKPHLKLNLAEKERLIRMYFAVRNFKARNVTTDRSNCRNVFG